MAKHPTFNWNSRWQPHAYGATKDYDHQAELRSQRHGEALGRVLHDAYNEQAEGLTRNGTVRAWRCA